MSRRRKFLFTAATLLLTLAMAEGLTALFFHYTKERFSFYDFSDYLIDEKMAKKMMAGEGYDRDLGWTMAYKTPHGERPRPVYYKEYFMATWGDSFTHCDQVQDHQTWQSYLSAKIEKNVINYGTGGYGTDQAYLSFKLNWPKVKTKIAVLGLVPENISRVANVYRKFYYPRTGGPMTKPRFILKEGKLQLIPNPIRSKEELIKLTDPAFLRKIGKHDFWYNRDDYPVFAFPFLSILFNERFWLELKYLKGDKRIDDMIARPAYFNDIWESPERDVLFALFDAFVKEAERVGTIPIIAVLPTKFEADELFGTKNHNHAPRRIIEYCRLKGYRIFDGITGMVRNAKTQDDINSYFIGHASPLGNQLIAEALAEYLLDEGLLPSQEATGKLK